MVKNDKSWKTPHTAGSTANSILVSDAWCPTLEALFYLTIQAVKRQILGKRIGSDPKYQISKTLETVSNRRAGCTEKRRFQMPRGLPVR